MIFTSEAVTRGHPDKICDQIADAILDACLSQDKESHVACEVCCTTGTVVLMGEISTKAVVDYKQIARDVLRDIGYLYSEYGIDYSSCTILDLIDKQSSEINDAVSKSLETRVTGILKDKYDAQGAGDQGIMFGFACSETNNYMPLSITLAHELAAKLEEVRKDGTIKYLRPDGKTQVSVEYDGQGGISSINTILISTQHKPGISHGKLQRDLVNKVINPVCKSMGVYELLNRDTKVIINPSGSFTIGGPQGDTGLTGRKLAVDTYGGHAKFGGGAMCGKDPSKVDRSAAYMARYIAKHLVAADYCNKCEVQLSYAIGRATPVSINVSMVGAWMPDSLVSKIVEDVFDCRPLAIIDKLSLKEFSYSKLSGKCQFGDISSPWEILDTEILETLRKYKERCLSQYDVI